MRRSISAILLMAFEILVEKPKLRIPLAPSFGVRGSVRGRSLGRLASARPSGRGMGGSRLAPVRRRGSPPLGKPAPRRAHPLPGPHPGGVGGAPEGKSPFVRATNLTASRPVCRRAMDMGGIRSPHGGRGSHAPPLPAVATGLAAERVLARRLRLVHQLVGCVQQGFDLGGRLGVRNRADAGRDGSTVVGLDPAQPGDSLRSADSAALRSVSVSSSANSSPPGSPRPPSPARRRRGRARSGR